MNGQADNLLVEMRKLYGDARVVKSAHFIAAHRKQTMHRRLGVVVIILNAVIFSPILELIVPNQPDGADRLLTQNRYILLVKALAIVAASLAGIQTLYNFQRSADSHLTAGNAYTSIYRRVGLLIAEYRDGVGTKEAIGHGFKALAEEYSPANSDSKANVPSDRDYRKARKEIKSRSESR